VGEPVDATFRLERNTWNGAIEPRLLLGQARPCAPAPIDVVGETGVYLDAVLGEFDAALERPARGAGGTRRTIDRRGESPLAILADVGGCGAGAVLAVCADVPRRLPGLAARTGGFALTSYHALERAPELAGAYTHLVALDPPAHSGSAQLLSTGAGYTHLAWGAAELRFAVQMHELEYGLRTWLAALYRTVRSRTRVSGEELEHLLRGDGAQARPARVGGRLIRVLAELGLVSLNRDLPALALAGTAQTALERSEAYRAYTRRLEDGRQYLSSANQPVPS
jgi:single-stranded-DNA-specific exonuclease